MMPTTQLLFPGQFYVFVCKGVCVCLCVKSSQILMMVVYDSTFLIFQSHNKILLQFIRYVESRKNINELFVLHTLKIFVLLYRVGLPFFGHGFSFVESSE